MLDLTIDAFFAERKEGWLKKKLKPDMTDEQKREIEAECEEEFSLEKWLPNAANVQVKYLYRHIPVPSAIPAQEKTKTAMPHP
ncbi:MAG: hypothetical protein JKY34_02675 [Kordiimonadaceae bacterium]|nr:hypothetical protein [Kordiimonadaceae bacterium]